MFINKDSLIINGINMGQYLVSVKYGRNKLWGEDSGRTLSGKMVATLIGIFPKIECSFRPLTQSEIELLAPIFDSARQTITYYDPLLKTNKTITTYSGDWNIPYRNINEAEPFDISFIGVDKL